MQASGSYWPERQHNFLGHRPSTRAPPPSHTRSVVVEVKTLGERVSIKGIFAAAAATATAAGRGGRAMGEELEEGELEDGELEMEEVGGDREADEGFGGAGGGSNSGGVKRSRGWDAGDVDDGGVWEAGEWEVGERGGASSFTASAPGDPCRGGRGGGGQPHPNGPSASLQHHTGGRGGNGRGRGQWEPPPFTGHPAMSLPITPPVSQYMGPLAGWAAGRASMPPPQSRPAGPGSGGARTPPFDSKATPFDGGGGWSEPHTTGKDGRDRSKRQRKGGARNSRQESAGAGHTGLPCVFWRQGMCKNGAQCAYIHGDSPVPCTNFNTEMGCRFGDNCAFAHVPGAGGGGSAAAAAAAAATPENPFATHATNCGCPACAPRIVQPPLVTHAAAEVGDAEEDGEVLEGPLEGDEDEDRGGGGGGEGEDGEGEDGDGEDAGGKDGGDRSFRTGLRSDPTEAVAARDAVLRACSVIESPGMVAAWEKFLSSIGSGRSNKLIPFWKQKQQLEQTLRGKGNGEGGGVV